MSVTTRPVSGPAADSAFVAGELRPYLSALDEQGEGATEEFLAAYSASLRAAYPQDAHVRTIFPFRRIFAVAAPLRED